MAFFFSVLPAIWPWIILVSAQVAGLAGKIQLAFVLLALFCGMCLFLGLLSPVALSAIVIGLALAACLPQAKGWVRITGHIALIGWCLTLGAHLLPGFHNLKVLDHVQAGAQSTSFTMHLNLDKPMVLFALLLAWPSMLSSNVSTRPVTLAAAIALLPALFVVGMSVGAVRFEPGLPEWWLVFAFSNLFLTSLTEEAFFRGYLQSAITSKFGAATGLLVASGLFGLVHFPGGPGLVIFAALLGLSCGLGYLATGRLWVPILMHFGFNFAHLALFTYPAPA